MQAGCLRYDFKTTLRCSIKTRKVTTDDEGRVLDLPALRTTLGTNLARMGVAPQIAQRIMRHGDYRTTLEYYTVLGLTDTAAAMDRLPNIGGDDRKAHRATGTCDIRPDDPRLKPRQLEREAVRNRANQCPDAARETGTPRKPKARKQPVFAAQNDGTREDATACDDYRREPERRPRQGSNL